MSYKGNGTQIIQQFKAYKLVLSQLIVRVSLWTQKYSKLEINFNFRAFSVFVTIVNESVFKSLQKKGVHLFKPLHNVIFSSFCADCTTLLLILHVYIK